jgi:hypothetical protein
MCGLLREHVSEACRLTMALLGQRVREAAVDVITRTGSLDSILIKSSRFVLLLQNNIFLYPHTRGCRRAGRLEHCFKLSTGDLLDRLATSQPFLSVHTANGHCEWQTVNRQHVVKLTSFFFFFSPKDGHVCFWKRYASDTDTDPLLRIKYFFSDLGSNFAFYRRSVNLEWPTCTSRGDL